MTFQYVAYNLEQGVVKGRVEAHTMAEARDLVSRQGSKPLLVRPTRRLPSMEELLPSLFRVSPKELIRFCRYLAAMLISGGSLLRTLEMLQMEGCSRRMRRTLEAIRKTLDEGGSLSSAMSQHPLVFSPLFISVVEVGEYTGRLAPALEQMADIQEKDQEAKSKAIRTMMYPAAIIALSTITMGVLITVALPPMLKVFDSMDTPVPFPTRVTILLFKEGREHFLEIVAAAVAVLVALSLLRRIPRVRYWMDVAQVRSPLVGPLVVSGELARFSCTMTLLMEAGVSLSTALSLGISGCKIQVLRRAFMEAEESLLSVHGLAAALKRCPTLPTMFVELVTMGEESNSLQRTMNDAATTYQKQLQQRLDSLLGMLEPASTLIVGVVVGFLAFSMFLPIYSSLNALK